MATSIFDRHDEIPTRRRPELLLATLLAVGACADGDGRGDVDKDGAGQDGGTDADDADDDGSDGGGGTGGGDDGGNDGGGGDDGDDDGDGGGDGTEGDGDDGGEAGDWQLDDQMGEDGTITFTNGTHDFLLEQADGNTPPWPPESRLWMVITSKTGGYETELLLSRFQGLFELGGYQFLVHPGLVTDHGVEEVGSDGIRVWLEYGEPYDDFFQGGGPEGRPSALLGTCTVAVIVRWESAQVDLDFERPMLVDSANHNGFFSVAVRPDDFPFTMRMGVESDASSFASNEGGERHPEDPFGYFVRENGMMGRYDGYAPTGSVQWNDYYVLERLDRATVVYMPDFRDIAVTSTYDGAFYGNWITPRAGGATVAITQTGLGATYSFLPLPRGEYAERVTLLVDRDQHADLDGYQALVDGIQ